MPRCAGCSPSSPCPTPGGRGGSVALDLAPVRKPCSGGVDYAAPSWWRVSVIELVRGDITEQDVARSSTRRPRACSEAAGWTSDPSRRWSVAARGCAPRRLRDQGRQGDGRRGICGRYVIPPSGPSGAAAVSERSCSRRITGARSRWPRRSVAGRSPSRGLDRRLRLSVELPLRWRSPAVARRSPRRSSGALRVVQRRRGRRVSTRARSLTLRRRLRSVAASPARRRLLPSTLRRARRECGSPRRSQRAGGAAAQRPRDR